MLIGFIFDDIIMNMTRNKASEFHCEGVDSYFTNSDNNIIYMYRGSLQGFYCKKGTHKSLDVPCPHFNVERTKMRQYLTNI